MTAYQLQARFPMFTLDAGCTITVEAIDPSTGAAVTGVVVSQVTIYGVNEVPSSGTVPDESPLYTVLPDTLPDEAA